MNGLFVTLPLLLLLLPSLNASDPPILVLEQTASAVSAAPFTGCETEDKGRHGGRMGGGWGTNVGRMGGSHRL